MYTNSLSPPHPKQKQVALVKHTPESVTSCIYHRREHSLCIEVWSFKVGSGRAITRICAVVRRVHASLTHIGVHNFSCNHLYCEYNSNCRNKSRAKKVVSPATVQLWRPLTIPCTHAPIITSLQISVLETLAKSNVWAWDICTPLYNPSSPFCPWEVQLRPAVCPRWVSTPHYQLTTQDDWWRTSLTCNIRVLWINNCKTLCFPPSPLSTLLLTFVRCVFWQVLDIHLCVSKFQSPQELEHGVEYSGRLRQTVYPTMT